MQQWSNPHGFINAAARKTHNLQINSHGGWGFWMQQHWFPRDIIIETLHVALAVIATMTQQAKTKSCSHFRNTSYTEVSSERSYLRWKILIGQWQHTPSPLAPGQSAGRDVREAGGGRRGTNGRKTDEKRVQSTNTSKNHPILYHVFTAAWCEQCACCL